MGWKKVGSKHKEKYERGYVMCNERHEREFLIEIIHDEFPLAQRRTIARAIDECCREVEPPTPMSFFVFYMKRSLGVG